MGRADISAGAQGQETRGTRPRGEHSLPTGQLHTVISSKMNIDEVFRALTSRGVADVSDRIDISKSSRAPVACGGRADVYRGQFFDGRKIAIKCFRMSLNREEDMRHGLKCAAQELYVWSKCSHPNILPLLGMAMFRGQIALISPWMEGGTLPHYIRDRFGSVSRYQLCAQVAEAVKYLHRMGIVHGEIKGANILVDEGHTVKLGGLSSAKMSTGSLLFTDTEPTGAWSFRWAAPELMLGENERSTLHGDIYSLGMTILEIISGSIPYEGLSELVVLGRLISGIQPTRPEQYLPSGDARANSAWLLIQSCWNPDPAARPSASEVSEKIKGLTVAGSDL